MIVKLTNRMVDAIKPGDRPAVAYDTDLNGFGVRIAPSGSLSWFVDIDPVLAGGRRVTKRRMSFGAGASSRRSRHGRLRRKFWRQSPLAKTPAAVRREERQSETFREFAERYLREEAEAKLKPGTVTNYRICVRKHAAPYIGAIKLGRITTADIARIHTKVSETRPMTANRIVECISSILRYAATCNLVPVGHNPTKGIKAFRENRRERFLNSDELGRLGAAILEAETVGISYEVDETKPTSKHAPKPENRLIKIDDLNLRPLRPERAIVSTQ